MQRHLAQATTDEWQICAEEVGEGSDDMRVRLVEGLVVSAEQGLRNDVRQSKEADAGERGRVPGWRCRRWGVRGVRVRPARVVPRTHWSGRASARGARTDPLTPPPPDTSAAPTRVDDTARCAGPAPNLIVPSSRRTRLPREAVERAGLRRPQKGLHAREGIRCARGRSRGCRSRSTSPSLRIQRWWW